VSFAIRSRVNSLSVIATVSLFKNGILFESVTPPSTGNTEVHPLTPTAFASGDDIEVQVVIPQGLDQANFLGLTVVVEFV
jgi:hypothetical protein